MADPNKAQLGIEVDDDTLKAIRQLRTEIEGLEKLSTGQYGARRSALLGGGRVSPEFIKRDQEYQQTLRLHKEGTAKLLKLEEDYENKSKPGMKRAAGWVHRMMYGEKVGSDEEAEREGRKTMQRMDVFSRGLYRTLTISSSIAHTLGPVPGGGMLHAGVAGAAAGYGTGAMQYDAERQEAGEKGTGLGRNMAGLMGMGKGMAGALALTALAKAIAGAVAGAREDENIRYRLGQGAGGDIGLRDEAMGWVRSGPIRNSKGEIIGGNPLGEQEGAGLASGIMRAGGGRGSMEAATRAQMHGVGSEFTQLIGTLAQGGMKREDLDANARRMWIDIYATGSAQGLQKGRIGELIAGAMQVQMQRSAGMEGQDPGALLRFAGALGKKDASFQGRRGFETIGRLESFGKGESGGLSNVLALMANGLGAGSSYVQAKEGAEKGFFSGKGGSKAGGLRERVEMLRSLAGGNEETAQILLANSGFGMTEAGKVLKNSGTMSDADWKKAEEGAKTDEQRAFANMAQMPWQNIDKMLVNINSWLSKIFTQLGGLKAIENSLATVSRLVQGISNFIGVVQDNKKLGIGDKDPYSLGNWEPGVEYGEGSKQSLEYFNSVRPGDIPEVADAYKELASHNKRRRDEETYHNEQVVQRDNKGEFHLFIVVKDSHGRELDRAEVKARQNAAPVQAP